VRAACALPRACVILVPTFCRRRARESRSHCRPRSFPTCRTLGLPENTPDFQLTLIEGARALGRALRALKPDLFVVNSSTGSAPSGWYATCQPKHEGVCVADEAPDLIPAYPIGAREMRSSRRRWSMLGRRRGFRAAATIRRITPGITAVWCRFCISTRKRRFPWCKSPP